MKDATIAGRNPRTDKEIEVEIDRLFGEIEQMSKNTARYQEATARKQAATWESIRWLEDRIHVGQTS